MHYISAVLFALSANMDNVAIGLAYGIKGVRIRFRSNLLIAFITSIGTLISMGAGATLTTLIPDKIAAYIGSGILIAMGLWFVITSLHKRLRAASSKKNASGHNAACETASVGGVSMEAAPGHVSMEAAPGRGPSPVNSGGRSDLKVVCACAAPTELTQIQDSVPHIKTGAVGLESGIQSGEPTLELGMGIGIDSSGTAVASVSSIPDKSFIGLRESVFLALALMLNNLGFGVGAKIAGMPILITSGCTLVCSMLLLSGGVFLGKHFGGTFWGRYTDLISGCIIIGLGIYEFLI